MSLSEKSFFNVSNRRKYNIKKMSNVVFWIVLILSIWKIVQYSYLPIIKLPFSIERYFVKPVETDGIAFNLAMGYIVSAIFYLIVVYYPDKVKRIKVEKVAIEELSSICIDAIMMVVLMYKNVCNKYEWDFNHLKDDSQFFDEKFYKRMEMFDAYVDADTRLSKKEDNGNFKVISWDDKLEGSLKDFADRIDQIITRYIYFLDDEIIEKSLAFKNNRLLIGYLGLPSNKIVSIYEGTNGAMYAERISLHMFRGDMSGKKTLLFKNDGAVDNVNILHDYINTLLSLRELCCKKTKFRRDIAIKYFCSEKCGQCGIAKFDK